VIVGEPSLMRMIDAHKGTYFFETVITGREAHASTQQLGASAIMAAGDLCHFLNELREEMVGRGDPSGRFEPPYATINVGMIHGGTAFNIIARECRFLWEYRALPDMEVDEIARRFDEYAETVVLPKLRETAPEASIATTQMCDVPPLAPEHDGAAEALVRELTGQNTTATVPFGTEGGVFQAAGMSTIVCGPGSIDQAHQPDEYIAIEQLEACTGFIERLAGWARREAA
jgi:acetylornithine deacetylase